MDDVFRALSDPSRRSLLDNLNRRNGQTLSELCAGLDMARQSVSKHLAVLEEAHLVTTQRRGREKLHFLNAAPINAIADRWINHYDRRRAEALADLKTALEQKPMTTSTTEQATEFVYTTYIKTTPEQLWKALTDPAFTIRYWGVELTSDWKVGSTITWQYKGVTMAGPDQTVLDRRCESPSRLQLARDHAGVRGAHRQQSAGGRGTRGRAAVQRDLRDRADGRTGEAHRDPRRVRARQHHPPRHLGGLADHPRQPQDALGDRCTAGVRVSRVTTVTSLPRR